MYTGSGMQSKLFAHSEVQSIMGKMKKRLSMSVGYGKTSTARTSFMRAKNPMGAENATLTVPIGANEHELIKLGNIK